jgi:hypothetical protein
VKIFGSIQELVELVYRIGSNTVTLKPNSSQANNVQFQLPNVTASADVVVSVNSTATLKNKTINAASGVDGNSIINLDISSLLPVAGDATKVLIRDASGNVISSKISNSNIDVAAQIALSKLFPLTSLRALQSDASGVISASSITTTELGHLSGVTSNIQTQLNTKVDENSAIVGATATKITFDSKGLVTAGTALAAGDLPSGIDATKIGAGSVDNTEFGYLNGLTSSAVGVSDSQTLLNKQVSSTAAITGALTLPAGTEAQRPTPVEGMVRLNTDTDSFEGYANGVWSGIGGGGTTDRITQASHGFVVGDVLYLNGATYTKAIATAANTAEVVGMVSRVIDASTFELTLSGEVSGLTGLTAGEVYFLSAATAGATTVTEPSTIGQVSVPVGVASSTTTMYVAPKRGSIVGGVNARAEVALTSGAVTNVQNVAGMSAGELSGWVFISSAAPKRFYVSAQFALSGAGGDYNLSYQTSGDAPPTGFLVDITTTGMIRVTLPASSGSTSAINYALNAPAIGASFPLTVDAGTILSGTVGAARLPAPSAYADAEATRMGLKQYLHGTTYNGGIAPTVSYISGGGTATINRCTFVPYQLQDGGWRVKFNIDVSLSVITRTALTVQINGITAATATQAVVGYLTGSVVPPRAVLGSASNQISCDFASNIVDSIRLSGDVELASKPTWAY